MKKLLFVLMLAVMGNTFAAPRSQKAKSTRAVTTSRISESDRKEIENVIQRDMAPIFNKLLSIGIYDYKKEIEKDASLFEKGFVISEPLKKEILKKYSDEIVKFILKSFDLKIKINQISYISENKVNATLDFTSRNLDKVLDIGGKDDILYERSFKRLGYKFVDEFEKVMKNKGNEDKKRNFYNVALEETINLLNENLSEIKEENVFLSNVPVNLIKVNGKWEIENLENLRNAFN
jgi:putative ATP-binding helicase protein